jgi:hypothetical protein
MFCRATVVLGCAAPVLLCCCVVCCCVVQLTDFDITNSTNPNPNDPDPLGARRPRRTALNAAARNGSGGKRPRSGMTPTIVTFRNGTRISLGSPGGSRIPGGVFHVLVNLLDYKMDLPNAIEYGPTTAHPLSLCCAVLCCSCPWRCMCAER